MTLPYRPLGNSGISVSVLGLGTVKLGRNTGVHYPQTFELPTVRHAQGLLDQAADLGINLLDTAPAYGSSEKTLGTILKSQRQKWVLTTKVGESFDGATSSYSFDAGAVMGSVHRSLADLQTDWLDVVLIHSDGDDLAILNDSDALPSLLQLKAQGLIRAVGISHKTIAGAERAIELGCDVIMATLNLSERQELATIKQAGESGCGVLVKKPLAGGFQGLDSLKFAADAPGVSSVVVGTLDPDHLRADALALQES
jgi:aryl-alcohol dehydrogenase-like predicted oxidoreductase